MCTYFGEIHILAKLALNQVRGLIHEYANMLHNNDL